MRTDSETKELFNFLVKDYRLPDYLASCVTTVLIDRGTVLDPANVGDAVRYVLFRPARFGRRAQREAATYLSSGRV